MIYEGLAHEGLYQAEEAQFVSGNKSYNFKANNTLSTHYTPALRNHEIFISIMLHKFPRAVLAKHPKS